MKNKKVYAVQVPPELQESRFEGEELEECGVIINGNKDFSSYTTPAYDSIILNLVELHEAVLNISEYDYKNVTELIKDWFPPSVGRKYTTRDIGRWKALAGSVVFDGLLDEYICEALSLMTGKKYKHRIIRGICQGDYNDVYYPDTYSDEAVKCLEKEYFNTGTEWQIHDADTVPTCAEEVDGYYMYCYTDSPRDEIAKNEGVRPEDLVMWEFDKYIRIPQYKEATI